MSDPTTGRHEMSGHEWWGEHVPRWAQKLTTLVQAVHQDVRQVINNQGVQMTQAADLQSAVAALQAEDGVVISALNDLLAKSQSGSVSATDVQAAIDTIRGEVANLAAAVQSTDPTPATPATPPGPAGP